MNTHNLRVNFGRHQGELWTRIPIPYLKWMINARHPQAEIAQAEMDRRGITTAEKMHLSGHAIDRASVRLLNCYLATRKKGKEEPEGIYSWLYRIAVDAMTHGDTYTTERGDRIYQQNQIKFIFKTGEVEPTLVSLMYLGHERKPESENSNINAPDPEQGRAADPTHLEGSVAAHEKRPGKIRRIYDFIRRLVRI